MKIVEMWNRILIESLVGSYDPSTPSGPDNTTKEFKQEFELAREFRLIKGDIPVGVKKLTLDPRFSQKLDTEIIPSSVESIELPTLYNRRFTRDSFHTSVKCLTIGDLFDQPFTATPLFPFDFFRKRNLPKNLEELKIGRNFKQRLGNTLPCSLKTLDLSDNISLKIERRIIPNNLTKLILPDTFNSSLTGILPNGLKILILGHSFNHHIFPGDLPDSLEEVVFGHNFNQSIEFDMFPRNLKRLKFGNLFDQPIKKNVLPKGLQHLNLGFSFNHPLDNIIPIGVKYFKLSFKFNHSICLNTLPDNLEILDLTFCHYLDINNIIIPENVRVLYLPSSFNNKINHGILPDKLEEIHFGSSFNKVIEEKSLPEGIKRIHFGLSFNKRVDWLPKSVEFISFERLYYQEFDLELPNLFCVKINSPYQIKTYVPLIKWDNNFCIFKDQELIRTKITSLEEAREIIFRIRYFSSSLDSISYNPFMGAKFLEAKERFEKGKTIQWMSSWSDYLDKVSL